MFKKTMIFLTIFIISILLIQSANALIVYLRPPKMIIRTNTTEVAESFFVVSNMNNITINITASTSENITDIVHIKNPVFSLEPNETKNIDFSVESKKSGIYSGEVQVTYSSETSPSITVPVDITVVVTGNPTKSYPYVPYILAVVVVILLILLFYFKRRVRVKWGK